MGFGGKKLKKAKALKRKEKKKNEEGHSFLEKNGSGYWGRK